MAPLSPPSSFSLPGRLSLRRKPVTTVIPGDPAPVSTAAESRSGWPCDQRLLAVPVGTGQRRSPSQGGFTLLELLISLTLLVLILVITLGALRMGYRSVAAAEGKMASQERFRTVLSVIDAQIQSQVPLTYEEEAQRKYYFKGEAKALRFSSNQSIWGGQRGYVLVDYRIEVDPAGREVLFAAEQTPGIEGRQEVRLIEAAEISFAYLYRAPASERAHWLDRMPEENAIPEKIRFRMAGGREEISLLCPVRVIGKVTTVQGGSAR